MKERILDPSEVLTLEDIHSHWHFKTTNSEVDSDNLLRINKSVTIIPRGRPSGLRNKRRRQSNHKEITRRDLLGFEYSRALFSRVIADAQRFTRPLIEPLTEPPTEPPIAPPIAPPITAEGVAQQEKEAAANAFFRPPAIRGRGGRLPKRGRDRGREIAIESGVGRGQRLSYARGHEDQFGVI